MTVVITPHCDRGGRRNLYQVADTLRMYSNKREENQNAQTGNSLIKSILLKTHFHKIKMLQQTLLTIPAVFFPNAPLPSSQISTWGRP